MTTGGHPPPISAEVFNVQRPGLRAEMIMTLIELTKRKWQLKPNWLS